MIRYVVCFCLIFCVALSPAQVRRAIVGFWNLENLHDPVPSADYIDGLQAVGSAKFHRSVPVDSLGFLPKEDYTGEWSNEALQGIQTVRPILGNDEFTATSRRQNTQAVYQQRLGQMSDILSNLGGQAPVVIGICEVENRQVVADLCKTHALSSRGYRFLHSESWDPRGIDVALLYRASRVVPLRHRVKEILVFGEDNRREYTRPVLIAELLVDGEPMVFFVNHWPSRRGGEEASSAKRQAAAQTVLDLVTEYQEKHPDWKQVVLGDFNDGPTDTSLRMLADVKNSALPFHNPMYLLERGGQGTIGYRDTWTLFDQILVSKNLLSPALGYRFQKAGIWKDSKLITSEGPYRNYPFRAWAGEKFTGGYSDHFPVYVVLERAVD